MTKLCTKCGTRPKKKSATVPWCQPCANEYERQRWSSKTTEEKIETHLKARYKISYQEWISKFEEQDFKCFLCDVPVAAELGNSSKRGVVDHCHNTGEVRKILCHHCNRALGLIKENKQTLQRMIDYLG